MRNKTLATINVLCILAPMLLGAMEEIIGEAIGNLILIGVLGLFMIIFGIWTLASGYRIWIQIFGFSPAVQYTESPTTGVHSVQSRGGRDSCI